MDVPVGNSPGPAINFNVTSGELLISFPCASSTVTVSCTSSVPSIRIPIVLSASNFSLAGIPGFAHSGGAI